MRENTRKSKSKSWLKRNKNSLKDIKIFKEGIRMPDYQFDKELELREQQKSPQPRLIDWINMITVENNENELDEREDLIKCQTPVVFWKTPTSFFDIQQSLSEEKIKPDTSLKSKFSFSTF